MTHNQNVVNLIFHFYTIYSNVYFVHLYFVNIYYTHTFIVQKVYLMYKLQPELFKINVVKDYLL